MPLPSRVAAVCALGGRVDVPRRAERPCERARHTDVDEEEDLPDVGSGLLHESGDVGELGEVLAHDGRVDLDAQARGDQCPDSRDGVVEVVLDRADALMGRRGHGR
jgi:hypothetical protein